MIISMIYAVCKMNTKYLAEIILSKQFKIQIIIAATLSFLLLLQFFIMLHSMCSISQFPCWHIEWMQCFLKPSGSTSVSNTISEVESLASFVSEAVCLKPHTFNATSSGHKHIIKLCDLFLEPWHPKTPVWINRFFLNIIPHPQLLPLCSYSQQFYYAKD